MTKEEYDRIFPKNPRLSLKTLKNKDTLSNIMNEELSNKLRRSHTLDGYIDKYGVVEGKIRYEKAYNNLKYARTKYYYIEKYGYEKGIEKWESITSKRGVNLSNFIEKYGYEKGVKKYNYWRCGSKRLDGYIKKYGEKEGLKRWINKNKKIANSNGKIPKEVYTEYENYRKVVYYYTNISISMFGIENIDKRGKIEGFDLDHKVSICFGFLNKINPIIIGSVYNLEILSQKDNCSKHTKCSMDYKDLVKLVKDDDFYNDIWENYEF